MIRNVVTILSVLATSLTVALIPAQVKAAGETGHSDLMRLMAAVYGLEMNAADFLASVNQAVDNVPFSAATQSGRASAKLHFATTVTRSDLDQKDFEKLMKNNGKRDFLQIIGMFFKNKAMGGGVASLGNAEAAEGLHKAMTNGDGILFGMGLHYLLDVGAPFHDGYLGALTNPVPVIGRMPFLHKIALGHLVDGTSPDRLSIAKIAVALDSMGPFLIALRESQRDGLGVNQKWLDYLKSQGIDVNDHRSILNWFLSQDVVKDVLQKYLPANQTADYAKVLVKELHETLKRLSFFKNDVYLQAQLDKLIQEVEFLRADLNSKKSINDLVFEMIDRAWAEGQLKERTVINHTVTDYFSSVDENMKDQKNRLVIPESMKLQDLIDDPRFETLPEYARVAVDSELTQKGTRVPYTRGWLVDQIVAKVTRGMISQSWEKFNTAYLNDKSEKAQISIEHEALAKIEKHFFSRTGQYVYNPGIEHWSKVREAWKALSPEERGSTLLDKIIVFSDLVVRTRLAEDALLHGPSIMVKVKIFIKTMGFVFGEEIRDPITRRGNFAVRIKAYRDIIVERLKRDYPQGLLTEQLLAKAEKHNERLNRKYNSDEAIGVVQKTAMMAKASAEFLKGVTSKGMTILRCEALFK